MWFTLDKIEYINDEVDSASKNPQILKTLIQNPDGSTVRLAIAP